MYECCTWRLKDGVLTLWTNSMSLPEVMASRLALSIRWVDSWVALMGEDSISLARDGRMGLRGWNVNLINRPGVAGAVLQTAL